MTITPIPGTDTVSFIEQQTGVKATAQVVVPVNADGSAMGGGSATSPSISGGEYNSTPPTLTNGQTDALQFDSRGNTKVTLVAPDGTAGATIGTPADAFSNGGASGVRALAYTLVYNGTTWDRTRGDTTGTYTVAKGTPTIANAQGSVGTTTGQMVPARVGRSSVTIINESTTVIRYGAPGVTAANGAYLAGVAGTAVTIPTAAAVHGIVGTGTAAFSYIENF